MGASKEQLKAVASLCPEFESKMDNSEESCEVCANWNGQKCLIDIFDDVLEGMDQT